MVKKVTYPLPFRYPTFLRTHHGDHTVDIKEKDQDNSLIHGNILHHCLSRCLPIKRGTGAFIDHLPVPLHLKVRLAVVTAVVFKLINSLKIKTKIQNV